jgi:N-acetyl-alpha-D-glucosaminyl L-malate synthase BshA
MADVAERHHLDIIHAHYAIPHANAALLARMAVDNKIKVVTTLHGTDITAVGTDPSYLPMVRLAIRGSDAVTAVSEFLKRETIEAFGIERHIDVVHNFACLPQFDENAANWRPRLSPDGAPLITHISNFRPVKRVMDVMKVFEIVRRECPCRLVMVGDGPDRLEAENFAREKTWTLMCASPANSWTSFLFWPVPTYFCCQAPQRASGWQRWRPCTTACLS